MTLEIPRATDSRAVPFKFWEGSRSCPRAWSPPTSQSYSRRDQDFYSSRDPSHDKAQPNLHWSLYKDRSQSCLFREWNRHPPSEGIQVLPPGKQDCFNNLGPPTWVPSPFIMTGTLFRTPSNVGGDLIRMHNHCLTSLNTTGTLLLHGLRLHLLP